MKYPVALLILLMSGFLFGKPIEARSEQETCVKRLERILEVFNYELTTRFHTRKEKYFFGLLTGEKKFYGIKDENDEFIRARRVLENCNEDEVKHVISKARLEPYHTEKTVDGFLVLYETRYKHAGFSYVRANKTIDFISLGIKKEVPWLFKPKKETCIGQLKRILEVFNYELTRGSDIRKEKWFFGLFTYETEYFRIKDENDEFIRARRVLENCKEDEVKRVISKARLEPYHTEKTVRGFLVRYETRHKRAGFSYVRANKTIDFISLGVKKEVPWLFKPKKKNN